jgi:hypothetical protein
MKRQTKATKTEVVQPSDLSSVAAAKQRLHIFLQTGRYPIAVKD